MTNPSTDNATATTPQAWPDRSLGQIAVSLPGATAVFRRAKLDFCCGGQVSLAQACADKGLDAVALCAELDALQSRPAAPALDARPPELIAHIIARYHEVHRQQLPELIRMARRVEAVHRDHPLVPVGLTEQLEHMEEELYEHMEKEESILFPMIQNDPGTFVAHPIAVMRQEHLHHGDQLARLAQLSNDAQPPQGACNTWRALYAGIAQLTDDLMSHIHLENNLLFPQFEPVH